MKCCSSSQIASRTKQDELAAETSIQLDDESGKVPVVFACLIINKSRIVHQSGPRF